MTYLQKLQLSVAFMAGALGGAAGVLTLDACVACNNAHEIDAAQQHIHTLDQDVTSHHQRLLELEGKNNE